MRADGGCLFAYAPAELAGALSWRAELIPITVLLETAPDGFGDASPVDLRRFGAVLADRVGPDGRHVVIADDQGEHRLWLRNGADGGGAAAVVPLDKDFETRMASLMRFHRRLFGRGAGPQPRGWALTAYRRARLEQMLRALDMHLAGASYRQIAAALGEREGASLSATEWKDSRSRAWVVRLVAGGRRMMNGGYRKLLRIR